MKECTKCRVEKSLDFFSKNGNAYRSVCKPCRNASAKEYRLANMDSMRAKDKAYYEANRTKVLIANKEYRAQHRENICEQKRAYYEQNKESILKYHCKRKDERNQQKRLRRKEDNEFRIAEALKARIHKVLNDEKELRSWDYIGCSKSKLRNWLKYQFNELMSWENYGSFWHIDHVIPIKKFNLNCRDNIEVCFHWSNLRPLEKACNMSKSDKIIMDDIVTHKNTLVSYIQKEGYQTIPEKAWWLRTELRYGNNPEDDFVGWFTKEMGNPQPSS